MTKTLDFKSKKRQWIGNPIESKYILCKICSWVKRKRKVRFWSSKFKACKCKEQSKRDCRTKPSKEEYYKIIREKSNGLGDRVWLFDYRSAFEKLEKSNSATATNSPIVYSILGFLFIYFISFFNQDNS